MNGLPRYNLYSIAFLSCLVSLRVMSLEAQGVNITTAADLLAQKEGELSTFVDAVEANSRNCGVLNGCSSFNCSRLSCYEYGIPGDSNYECLEVAINKFCDVTASCKERNFDFSKGYLRRVDTIDNHIARTVCTQRFLDDNFKQSSVSDESHFFRVFFGAVDGTVRIYPGADENCDNMYDPRVRPWYIESTYVPKVVTVLIDSGLNMRDRIIGTDDETYIGKAITTALTFLDTLRDGKDYVTLISFDGDGINQLNTTMIYNSTVLYQSFYDSLTRLEHNASKSDPNATDTNNAINFAINQLTNSKSIPSGYLKVVIALIGGQQYKDISDLNVSVNPNMNLFLYSFRTQQPPQCNQTIRASLEGIPNERLNNLLYALQSYFSFLAKLHRRFVKNQTDYGTQYEDFSGIDTHTLTLSKAAFGPFGELLGVMGLDFFEQKVQEQYPSIRFPSIVEEAGKHDTGREFDTSTDLVTNVCFDHTDACPGLDTANVQGFLCEKAKAPDGNIGCCGECKASKPPSYPPTSPPEKPEKKEVWPPIVGTLGGLTVLTLVLVCIARKKIIACVKGKKTDSDPDFDFPGPDNEIPLPTDHESGLRDPGVITAQNSPSFSS